MRVASVLRLPALHFILIGATLFALAPHPSTTAARVAPVRAPIVIPATTVAELVADHQRAFGAPPTSAEISTLIENEADREILYREALMLGLDRADPAVERRVVEKVRFLYGDDAGTNTEAFRQGVELGLHRNDIVVRRTLVTKMELLAKRASRSLAPTGPALERALESHLEEHAERYARPAEVSLRHVLFSTDRRGHAAEADATAWRRELASAALRTPDATGGDLFALGHAFQNRSSRALAKIFGTAFADAVMTLDPGSWSPPIPSSYGTHLVWVTTHTPARVPELAEIRARVLRGYLATQHEVYLEEFMAALRDMYEIRTESPSHTPEADA